MRPSVWNPPIELSLAEEKVVKRIRKAKLFVFLRQIRQELFDSDFQLELATIFKDSSVGLCPVPPAQLALFIKEGRRQFLLEAGGKLPSVSCP